MLFCVHCVKGQFNVQEEAIAHTKVLRGTIQGSVVKAQPSEHHRRAAVEVAS